VDQKKFLIITFIIALSGLAGWGIKYRAPEALVAPGWKEFPLLMDDWIGKEDIVAQGVIDLLKPDHIFNANYIDDDGNRVNLFLGSFSDPRGGPHSPLNCLPASGWVVEGSAPRSVDLGNRTLAAKRLLLSYRQVAYAMDFWYVTPWGETSSDYRLKFNEMLTSLTLQPRHLTFVRFIAKDTPGGLAALNRFEKAFLIEIYSRLPVDLQ
jgi:EpsI family protein